MSVDEDVVLMLLVDVFGLLVVLWVMVLVVLWVFWPDVPELLPMAEVSPLEGVLEAAPYGDADPPTPPLVALLLTEGG
jgi:hypothetical protein